MGIFTNESGKQYTNGTTKINCHICGKSFFPRKVTLVPTDTCAYYLGVWCRQFLFYTDEKLCDHIVFKPVNEDGTVPGMAIWMYEVPDPMSGRIIVKESNIKNENNESTE